MPDAITLDSIVARNETIAAAEVGEEIVMLHIANDAYYDTDAVGADIWREMAAPQRVGALCEALQQRYAVDPQTCEADVLAFLNEACREDVIRIVPPTEASSR